MISVSIIEDDALVGQILASWISDAHDFRCAGVHTTGAHALAQLSAEKPDVALFDINLPDRSSIECIQHLKPMLPKTQFLMLTVYEDADHIFKALEAGATGYLLKRNLREEVLASVRQVYEGGSHMPSFIARKVLSFFHSQSPTSWEADQALSPREREVLELLMRGYSCKEIVNELSISTCNVNSYIHRIYDKLRVQSQARRSQMQFFVTKSIENTDLLISPYH
jgi:DNA-binding NarL/FixJ family response regulator